MTPTVRAAAVASLAFLVDPCPAQEPAPLLIGQRIVDPESGKEIGKLGIEGHVRHATPVGPNAYLVDNRNVDLGEPLVVEWRGEELVARSPSGEIHWRRGRDELGVRKALSAPQRLLAEERIVLMDDKAGVVALHRSTGAVAWRQEPCPKDVSLLDGELLLAAGTIAGSHELRVFALLNGAPAFRAELPAAPRAIAAAKHGIAVIGDGFLSVFDRAGPQMFSREGDFDRVASGPSRWFTLTGKELRAWSREGKPLWSGRCTLHDGVHQLLVTEGGDPLVLAHHRMADSGVQLQLWSGREGERLWESHVPGLGVPHSKYRHDAFARLRGERIHVVSQGSAGAFFVELDERTGTLLVRHELAR